MMDLIIGCSIFGAFIMLSFITGLHYGSKIRNQEKIDMPKIEPVKAIKEHKENKKKAKEQEIMEINLANIESYDGTGIGQKDIPR